MLTGLYDPLYRHNFVSLSTLVALEGLVCLFDLNSSKQQLAANCFHSCVRLTELISVLLLLLPLLLPLPFVLPATDWPRGSHRASAEPCSPYDPHCNPLSWERACYSPHPSLQGLELSSNLIQILDCAIRSRSKLHECLEPCGPYVQQASRLSMVRRPQNRNAAAAALLRAGIMTSSNKRTATTTLFVL